MALGAHMRAHFQLHEALTEQADPFTQEIHIAYTLRNSA